ncbi:MAG: Uncharacterised protein [Methanobacteriota archaeon]|nr:MAG: Uncharacterised protein [Euryarchaeota archaeon]
MTPTPTRKIIPVIDRKTDDKLDDSSVIISPSDFIVISTEFPLISSPSNKLNDKVPSPDSFAVTISRNFSDSPGSSEMVSVPSKDVIHPEGGIASTRLEIREFPIFVTVIWITELSST